MKKAQSLSWTTIVVIVLAVLFFFIFLIFAFNIGGLRDLFFSIIPNRVNNTFLLEQQCFTTCLGARGLQDDQFQGSDFCGVVSEGDHCYNDASISDSTEAMIYNCRTTNDLGEEVELDEVCCQGGSCSVT